MRAVSLDKAVRNDEWISDDSLPDPDPLPRIPGYKLLIRPVAIRRKTKGGIELPDLFMDDLQYLTTVGKVLAVGEAAYKDENRYPMGPWCKVGDVIVYGRNVGSKFFYKGVKLLVIFEDQVEMVIDDPHDMDKMFDLTVR